MEELPTKVRLELCLWIHHQKYSMINFFDNKDNAFKAWVSTLLKPLQVTAELIIYLEGEDINDSKHHIWSNFILVYFITNGKAGLVLKDKTHLEPYVKIEEGEMFGHTDLANNKTFMEAAKSFKRKLSIKS